jgi:hypothetical protein
MPAHQENTRKKVLEDPMKTAHKLALALQK